MNPREFRFFVSDGDVLCGHPYWPMHALERSLFASRQEKCRLSVMEARRGTSIRRSASTGNFVWLWWWNQAPVDGR